MSIKLAVSSVLAFCLCGHTAAPCFLLLPWGRACSKRGPSITKNNQLQLASGNGNSFRKPIVCLHTAYCLALGLLSHCLALGLPLHTAHWLTLGLPLYQLGRLVSSLQQPLLCSEWSFVFSGKTTLSSFPFCLFESKITFPKLWMEWIII